MSFFPLFLFLNQPFSWFYACQIAQFNVDITLNDPFSRVILLWVMPNFLMEQIVMLLILLLQFRCGKMFYKLDTWGRKRIFICDKTSSNGYGMVGLNSFTSGWSTCFFFFSYSFSSCALHQFPSQLFLSHSTPFHS